MTRRSLLILFIFALVFVGCRKKTDHTPVIASVNGSEVQLGEFNRFIASRLGDLSNDEMSEALRSQLLDELITRRVIIEAAENAKLEISDSEIVQTMQDDPQKKSATLDDESRQGLANDLLIEKYYKQKILKDVRVTPEEIEAYIEKNKDRLTDKPGFYVREIRVQTREEAERIRSEAIAGKTDFADLVRQYSQGARAEQGGLTHYDEGQMPAVLESAIRPLRPGDISAVVQSNYGFHIFKLEQRTQVYAPETRRSVLDKRREMLGEELISRRNQEAVDVAVDKLMTAAKVKINNAALGFTYSGRFRQN
ncbi:MAG: peptidylprolyl isomerase [Acidobacteriota bacterium]